MERVTFDEGDRQPAPMLYNVNSNLLTITQTSPASATITDNGFIDPLAQFIAFSDETEPGATFIMRQGTANTADVNGERYNLVSVLYEPDYGLELSAGYVECGNGTLDAHIQYNSDDGVVNETESGIEFDITNGLISFGDSDPDRRGVISPDENYMAIVNTEEEHQEIIFLMKSSSLEKEDLFGRYFVLDCYFDMDTYEPEIETAYVLLDGEGNFTVPGEGETGTYDVDSFGRIKIDGETTYGPVSPDGNFIIVPSNDGASFLVKAPNPTIEDVTSTDANVTSINSHQSTSTTDNALQSDYQSVPDGFKAMTDVVQFTATVTGTDPCEFQFDTSGQFGTVSDKVLLKLKDSSDSLAFEYASQSQTTAGNYVDGTWWITGASGYLSESATLDPAVTYTIHMAITDNGDYDLDADAGEIEDPTVLGAVPQASSSSDGDGDGGGGGGGCFIRSLLN